MDIVISGTDGRAVRQTGDFTLDLAYGSDEDRFTLSDVAGPALGHGWRWWADGMPYGGIVDTIGISSASDGVTALSYSGRDVHGIMAGKVVRPDSGQSHLVVSGEANALLGQLLSRCSVPWLSASGEGSGVEIQGFRFNRYIDLWTGIRMMLAASGARLDVRFVDGAPVLSAVEADTYGDIPSELVDFTAERKYRPVNHLIGLGSGEGAAREVVDWYADASGAVSQTQTLTGLDEVAEVYDYNGSDDLSADTRAKLEEYQGQGTFDVSLPDWADVDVGDYVTASDAVTGYSVRAQVVKVVLKVSAGTPTISYETGTPQWPEEED